MWQVWGVYFEGYLPPHQVLSQAQHFFDVEHNPPFLGLTTIIIGNSLVLSSPLTLGPDSHMHSNTNCPLVT